MGICRDTFGKLSYTLVTQDKRVYSVTKGENRIIRHYPYVRTNARTVWWEEICPFASFVKAVRFLKANADELI